MNLEDPSGSGPGSVDPSAAQGARRAALLEAARRVLARRGLAGMTTREVARRRRRRRDLLRALPGRRHPGRRPARRYVSAALGAALRTCPRAWTWSAGSSTSPAACCTTPTTSIPNCPAIPDGRPVPPRPGRSDRRPLRQFHGWATALIGSAVERGDLPPVDPDQAFTAFFSLYFGLLVLGLRGEMPRARQLALLEASLRRLLGALEEPVKTLIVGAEHRRPDRRDRAGP